MIPRTLHQVWLGPDPIPPRYLEFLDGWRALHPRWAYRLWTDGDLLGDLGRVAALNPVLACKASVVRVYALLRYGGVYADMDVEWNRSLDELLPHRAFAGRAKNGHVANAVQAAEPRHEAWAWMWSVMPTWAEKPPPWGPKLLTEAVDRHPGSVEVLPHTTFYPFNWNEEKRPAAAYPDAIAVHHCDHTWRRR